MYADNISIMDIFIFVLVLFSMYDYEYFICSKCIYLVYRELFGTSVFAANDLVFVLSQTEEFGTEGTAKNTKDTITKYRDHTTKANSNV